MSKTLPKLVIFGDPERKSAVRAVDSFLSFAKGKAEILANFCDEGTNIRLLNEADYAIAFGGDGTILSAAKDLSQTDTPVIGVNVGRLGFLAEFKESELQEMFDQLISDSNLIEKRMILKCCVERDGKELFCSTAINEVAINAGYPHKMIELKMAVGDKKLASCISDGLLISTPTGSTAYNLSAGGPILSSDLSAIVITPMCPHTLSFRPIVISAKSKVSINPVRVNEATTLTLDGNISSHLSVGDTVTIEKHSDGFYIVNNPHLSQWDTLASKLNWAGIPKYSDSNDD